MTATDSTDPTSLSHPATCEVLSLDQLRRAGVSARRASRLCGPAGPWRRLHPGVVLLQDTEPTRRQLLHAAVARFGPAAVITGSDALRAHGVKCRTTGTINLLLPEHCRVAQPEGIRSVRTTRLPEPAVIGGLPFAPPARAAIDLARLERDPERIENLLTLPLYWGLCEREDLRAELDAGDQRGSAAVRAILRELDDHATYAHGLAAKVLRAAALPLPPPTWNMTVCDRRGRRIGEADAWWDEIGMAWQYRAEPGGRGGFSHLALTATGIILVRCTAGQLRQVPLEVARELVRAFERASRTPRPKVRAVRTIGTAA